MNLARLIAAENAELAIAIIKSQRKAEVQLFVSTDEMNKITHARNLDARIAKAENLFNDYQNSNNQDMQHLIEFQRQYNQRYRIPLAK